MKNIKLILTALFLCTIVVAQSKPIKKVQQKNTKTTKTPKPNKIDDEHEFYRTLSKIFNDAHDDFKKYMGPKLAINEANEQTYKYGLTLGQKEELKRSEHSEIPDAGSLLFFVQFANDVQQKKSDELVAFFKKMDDEMEEYWKYKIVSYQGWVNVSDTNNITVYSYKIVNNKFNALAIYSCGKNQLARNKNKQDGKSVGMLGVKSGLQSFIALLTLQYKVSSDYSFGADYFELGFKNTDYPSKNIGYSYRRSYSEDAKINFEISNIAYFNSKKYIFIDTVTNNTVLEKECAIVLSHTNFREIKSKGETKMDFGNGLETFKFMEDGKTNSAYKSVFNTKKEILLANKDKTIIIGVLDMVSTPLITTIKTPKKLIELTAMTYRRD